MHKSAYDNGGKFLNSYWRDSMKSILEIGSLDVNGTVRDFQPEGSKWTGVDLEEGAGVDLVILPGAALPFPDKSFDLTMASSVFEHDAAFWVTLEEMVRVTKDDGVIYINAPSNGVVHRYPIDCFRFYPDAGIAMLAWIQRGRPEAQLVESFVCAQDGDVWNDFVAVFSIGEAKPHTLMHTLSACRNVWAMGSFLEETQSGPTEDLEIINDLRSQLSAIKNSRSWRITKPLRAVSKLTVGRNRS
jgi:SAM-dependent methyltransferase